MCKLQESQHAMKALCYNGGGTLRTNSHMYMYILVIAMLAPGMGRSEKLSMRPWKASQWVSANPLPELSSNQRQCLAQLCTLTYSRVDRHCMKYKSMSWTQMPSIEHQSDVTRVWCTYRRDAGIDISSWQMMSRTWCTWQKMTQFLTLCTLRVCVRLLSAKLSCGHMYTQTVAIVVMGIHATNRHLANTLYLHESPNPLQPLSIAMAYFNATPCSSWRS